MICKSREQVSQSKEKRRDERERPWRVAIAEVAKDGDGQVHGELGGDGNDVDLELRIEEAGQEEVAVDGIRRYRASAETASHHQMPSTSQSPCTPTKSSGNAVKKKRPYQLKIALPKLANLRTCLLIFRRSLSIMPSTTLLSKLSSSRSKPCGLEAPDPAEDGLRWLSKSRASTWPMRLWLELRDAMV